MNKGVGVFGLVFFALLVFSLVGVYSIEEGTFCREIGVMDCDGRKLFECNDNFVWESIRPIEGYCGYDPENMNFFTRLFQYRDSIMSDAVFYLVSGGLIIFIILIVAILILFLVRRKKN